MKLTLALLFLSTFTLASEKHITLLATNDIHGGVEPVTLKDGSKKGGMAILSGIVKAIRLGVQTEFGADNSGVLVLDAGDQFQGTLLSNYDKGMLTYATMNAVGYDAAIPGNHDYDFGPTGNWLENKVSADNPDKDPRGSLKALLKTATFPLISSSTYSVASLKDTSGKSVSVTGDNCKTQPNVTVNWPQAQLAFQPYTIKNIGGVRVALIGIDNDETPELTTLENVADLCFRDEKSAYLDTQALLKDKADVFVMIIHDGNTDREFGASDLVKQILAARPGSLNAVIAGHTHYVNHELIQGVPLIQSGANGEMFGRIDLVFDTDAHALVDSKMKFYAGMQLYYNRCASAQEDFCVEDTATHSIKFDGVVATSDPAVEAIIAKARVAIAPLAGQKLGHAAANVTTDRISESPLADLLSDALRTTSGAEVAFVNTGGIRTDFTAGTITYEDLFRVMPFDNHGVLVGPMPAAKLIALLQRSAMSCGSYGPLMESGLKVTYDRDCDTAVNEVDPKARLHHVETLSGETLLDVDLGIQPSASRVFQVATLDFLAEGGSGFSDFIGTPLEKDLGIFREVITQEFVAHPVEFSSQTDGRWVALTPARAK